MGWGGGGCAELGGVYSVMTFLKASVVCEKFQIFTTIRSLLRPTVDNQLVAAVNYCDQ